MDSPLIDPATVPGTSRRTFLTRSAAGAAAGGLLWVAPAVLSVDAAAAASCGVGGSVSWTAIALVNTTLPASSTYTSNTVVTTMTRTSPLVAPAGTDAFTIGPPEAALGTAANNFGGQTAKYLFMRMVNAASGSTLSITFAFSKSVNTLTFTLFDIDGATGSTWWDKLTITAVPTTAKATVTTPGSTPPSGAGANLATPIILTGNGTARDDRNDGNAKVVFAAPVSSVTITYTANKTATTDQYVGISDLTWNGCT